LIATLMTFQLMLPPTEPARQNEARTLFQDYDRPGSPGASVMVIHRGKVVLARGYGLPTSRDHRMRHRHQLRLASVTKQFTAMAVMILAERKQLSFDDRLTDFFPEFPPTASKSRSGISEPYFGLIDYEDVIPKATEIPVSTATSCASCCARTRLTFRPAQKYRYSNSAYALLALIVEARSGNTSPVPAGKHLPAAQNDEHADL